MEDMTLLINFLNGWKCPLRTAVACLDELGRTLVARGSLSKTNFEVIGKSSSTLISLSVLRLFSVLHFCFIKVLYSNWLQSRLKIKGGPRLIKKNVGPIKTSMDFPPKYLFLWVCLWHFFVKGSMQTFHNLRFMSKIIKRCILRGLWLAAVKAFALIWHWLARLSF